MERNTENSIKELLNSEAILSKRVREFIAAFWGITEAEISGITYEEVIDIRMILRAFNDGRAWEAVMKRAYGPLISYVDPAPMEIKVIRE